MDRENMKFWLPIITLVLINVSALLGYFFIDREQIKEIHHNIETLKTQKELNQAELGKVLSEKVISEIKADYAAINEALQIAKTNGEIVLNLSQTKINEINRDINALELELKQANIEIEKLSKNTNLVLDLSTLINDVQPNLAVICEKTESSLIEIRCIYKNIGKHKVYIHVPTLTIYDSRQEKVIDAKNYKLSGISDADNTIPTDGQGSDIFSITDLNDSLPSKYKVRMEWKASLHKSVEDVVRPFLTNNISEELLNGLITTSYTYTLSF